MLKKAVAGMVVAVCTVTAWQSHVAAQGGGRGNAAPPAGFPTEKQFAESKEAQRHVAAAMALAKTDLVDQAKGFCTATGVQREAVARQAQGLAPIPDVHIEPVKIFDNLYYIGFNDVGAWATSTSDGTILTDSLNTA